MQRAVLAMKNTSVFLEGVSRKRKKGDQGKGVATGKEETEKVSESQRSLVSKGQLPGRHRFGKSRVGRKKRVPREIT